MVQAKAKSRDAKRTNNKTKPTTTRSGQRHLDSTELKLQQKCLDIFRDALNPSMEDAKILQKIKGHLFNRDFAAAFGNENYLRVYAGRWSSSRALCYLRILQDVQEHFARLSVATDDSTENDSPFEVVCLGGGAGAEVVALGAWLSIARSAVAHSQVAACFVDVAAWSVVVDSLHQRIVNPPVLSAYASAAAKESNKPLLPAEHFTCSFKQQDVLAWSDDELEATISHSTDLVTLMFTLNELYTISVPKTQHLLSQITSALSPGALLLVVDSPGSYSTVSINGAEKRYPMQWLLDYTLLGIGRAAREPGEAKATSAQWTKIVGKESEWFRLPSSLQYPIELENMRYQIHIYQRLPIRKDD